MKIAVIGTGYVGLVAGACYAETGHTVVCADSDFGKIERLQRLEEPLQEPGLHDLLQRNASAGRLRFTTDTAEAVRSAEIAVITVGTPPLPDGAADLSAVFLAAQEIAAAAQGPLILVIKSTVPVGTSEAVAGFVREMGGSLQVASVPEFMREGSAIRDTLHSDRVVIGASDSTVRETLSELNRAFTDRIICTDPKSAEMIKYASNAFLAAKITFMNEIANLCEKLGADAAQVAKGMGSDRRIGEAYLQAGIGYGGSCFPKDIRALLKVSDDLGYDFRTLKAVESVNRDQPMRLIAKLEEAIGSLDGKNVGIWGLSYKPDTDDIRESRSLFVIRELLRRGARLRAYDPAAVPAMRAVMPEERIVWCDSARSAAEGSDALCILTDWDEFKRFPLAELPGLLNRSVVVDGRNLYAPAQAVQAGIDYCGIGRPLTLTLPEAGKI